MTIRAAKARIPIIRPTLVEYEEVEEAFRDVWDSGLITVGRYTARFEEAVQETVGAAHAIAVSSCTAGLMLAVKALGLTGEVVVPSFTFTATVHALVWNGITPVFCDILPDTLNIDQAQAKALITENTSAIMPVYTFGLPPDIEALQEVSAGANIPLIFDSAQGLGASYKGRRAGGFGNVEVFSLSPTKVVSAIEGGLVTTNDGEIARQVRSMRDYGKSRDGEDIDFVGLSARISEFHSIVGMKNLGRIRQLIEARRRVIALYRQALADLPGIRFQTVPEDRESTGNYMVILVEEEGAGISRDGLYRALKEKGIETKRYYFPPVHLQQAYLSHRNAYAGKLPVTEKVANEALALPLFSHMEDSTVHEVCRTIAEIIRSRGGGTYER